MMNERQCDLCGKMAPAHHIEQIGFCLACEVRLHEEADAEHADADESASDLEERMQLALDRSDADLLDSATGMTEEERRWLG